MYVMVRNMTKIRRRKNVMHSLDSMAPISSSPCWKMTCVIRNHSFYFSSYEVLVLFFLLVMIEQVINHDFDP